MMQSKKLSRKAIGVFLLLILCAIFAWRLSAQSTGWVGGSVASDLHQQLAAIAGEPYDDKIVEEKTVDGQQIVFYESMEFQIKKKDSAWWDDTMPEKDPDGVPLSTAHKVSVLECKVLSTRYCTVNGEKSGTTAQKCVTYLGYDDNDLNSKARATLFEHVLSTTYSPSEGDFAAFGFSQ